jgi:diguanylate cyclase (GGDEF)-like protein/PAS domain S-box-containing protein
LAENRFLKITPIDLERFEKLKRGVLIYTGEGEIRYANPAALLILGYASVEDMRNGWKLVPPEYKIIIEKRLKNALSGIPSPPFILRLITGDGRSETIKSRVFPVIFEGEKMAMAVFTRELEDRLIRVSMKNAFEIVRRIVEPLLENQEVDLKDLMEFIYNNLKDMFIDLEVAFINLRKEPVFISTSTSNFPCKEKCYLIRSLEEGNEIYITGEEIGEKVFTIFTTPLICDGRVLGALEFRREGYGTFTPDDIAIFKVTSEVVSTALKISNLIKDIRREKDELFSKAMKDSLTGAYTRYYLEEFAKRIIEYLIRDGKKVTLVMIDIDNMKEVNDTYGHLEGDKLLRDFSKVVISNIRSGDFLIRLGGDEFLLVLPKSDEYGARRTLERIQKEFDKINKTRNPKILFSYGISVMSDMNLENAIKEADFKMYKMKRLHHI